MSEITLRNVKGSPLTYSELDDNFLYLSQSYLLADATASLSVSVAISSSVAVSASQAQNAVSSSYPITVTGSTLYSVNPNGGVEGSTINGIYLGASAGNSATNAYNSNFLGNSAGLNATNAADSNFLGNNAGAYAVSASYSTLIGYRVGYNSVGGGAFGIKSNNIIIGTNITLADGRKDSINFGGLIFGTGSYFDTSANPPFSGSANGRIGINQPLPIFSLDVSGSGRYTNGLTVTGSLKMSTTTGTPSNTATPAGYYQAELNGSTVYIPYYT